MYPMPLWHASLTLTVQNCLLPLDFTEFCVIFAVRQADTELILS